MRFILLVALFYFGISTVDATEPKGVGEVVRLLCTASCTSRMDSGYIGPKEGRCFIRVRMKEVGKKYSVTAGSDKYPGSIVVLIQNYPSANEDVMFARRVEDTDRDGKADICSRGRPMSDTEEPCEGYQALYRLAIADLLDFIRRDCSRAESP